MEEEEKMELCCVLMASFEKILPLDFYLTTVSRLPLLVSHHRTHHMFLPWKIIHAILWKVF